MVLCYTNRTTTTQRKPHTSAIIYNACMNKSKILTLGKFFPNDLIVSVAASNRKVDPAIEAQIDTLWEIKKRTAAEQGRTCYNGTSYRLNSLEQQGSKVFIEFGLLEYKTRSILQTIPGYSNLSSEYHHFGCYSGATVKTSDDKYLIVELSGKSMNTFTRDMLGGIIEKPSEIANGADVFNCLYTELEEEACINKNDILEFYLRSIFLTPNTHCCFYFEVTLQTSSEELQKRFILETADPDIQSLKTLSKDEYLDFLKNHESQTKQLIAEVMTI